MGSKYPPGNWNGSGTADPVTDEAATLSPPALMVPFLTFGGTSGVSNNILTTNFGASPSVGAVPAGFTFGWTVPSGNAGTGVWS